MNAEETIENGRHFKSIAKYPRLSLTILYTVSFLCMFGLIWGPMLASGKVFIWSIDGLAQHYMFFVYEGEWLREIIHSVLEGNPVLPMWDPAMGYGADIIVTMGAYVGDPLNMLSALSDAKDAEYLYTGLIVFRIYLAGLSFIGFIKSRGYSNYATLLGALSYAFCGWTSITLLHPFFVYPLVFFPLLLWGADRVFEKRKPALFIIAVALLFLTYFYFGYMSCIMLVPYCLFRAYQANGGWRLRPLVSQTVKFVIYLMTGIMLAAIILLPILGTLLGSGRLSLERTTPAIYSPAVYASLLTGFGGVCSLGKDTFFGVSSVCLFAIATLFSTKGDRAIKAGFIALTIGALLPVFGKIMNGFTYCAERWIWAYAFFLIYTQVRMTPKLLKPTRKASILTLAIMLFIIIGTLVAWKASGGAIVPTAALCSAFVVCMVLMFRRAALSAKTRQIMLAITTCVCLVIANWGFWYFGWHGGGRAAEHLEHGAAYARHFGDTPLSMLLEIDDDGIWRADRAFDVPSTPNASASLGMRSADFYSSLYNNNVDVFDSLLGITSDTFNHRVQELRSRSWLESFMGMRYFIAKTSSACPLPYGVESQPLLTRTIDGVEYGVYENTLALPFATVYPKETLSLEEFMSMTIAERQVSLLSVVTLENGQQSNVDSAVDEIARLEYLDYEVEPIDEDVSIEHDEAGGLKLIVAEDNAKVRISIAGLERAETYIEISDLEYDYRIHHTSSDSIIERLKDTIAALSKRANENYALTFSTPTGNLDMIFGYTQDSHMYGGKDDWLVNLGDSSEGNTEVTISFSNKGTYSIGKLAAIGQPVDILVDQAREKQASSLNTTSTVNGYQISGAIQEKSIVLFKIPWSRGWSATINGSESNLEIADVAFASLSVDSGEHAIELSYETPGLRMGAMISLLGLFALLTVWFRSRRSCA